MTQEEYEEQTNLKPKTRDHHNGKSSNGRKSENEEENWAEENGEDAEELAVIV